MGRVVLLVTRNPANRLELKVRSGIWDRDMAMDMHYTIDICTVLR